MAFAIHHGGGGLSGGGGGNRSSEPRSFGQILSDVNRGMNQAVSFVNERLFPVEHGIANGIRDKFSAVVDNGSSSARSAWTDGMGNPVGYNSGAASAASYVTALPQYPYADIASQYGMDQATAYREALANTAHMREVQDLQRAGLNPVLSATGGSGAASFSGNVAYPMSFGATTASGGGSASAAYYGGGSGGKKGSSASGLASMLGNTNVQKAVSSVASAAVGGITKSFPLGAAAYYGAQAVLGGLFSRR